MAVTKVAPVSNAKAVAKAKAVAVAKTKVKEAGETVAAAARGGSRLTEANYTASVVREGLRSSHSLPTKQSNEESHMKVRTTSIMLVVSYFVCFILPVYA